MKNKFTILFTAILAIISIACVAPNKLEKRTEISIENSQIIETIPKFQKADLYSNEVTESKYDLRDYINIKVEDQKNYNLCYTFASLSMLETYFALVNNEYYDFSEIHMAVADYAEHGIGSSVSFAGEGGSFYNIYSYLSKGNGPILEEEMPYDNFYTSLGNSTAITNMQTKALNFYNSNKSNFTKLATLNSLTTFANIEYSTKMEITQGSSDNDKTILDNTLLENRNNIKNHIKNNGGCIASINVDNGFGQYNSTHYANLSTQNISNHMIVLVGWDDNYQPGTWSKPGAYICLNSWGQDWGDDGYFYISYSDNLVETSVFGVSSASTTSNSNIVNNINNNSTSKMFASKYYYNEPLNAAFCNVIDLNNEQNKYISSIDTGLNACKSYAVEISFVDSLPSSPNFTVSDSNLKQLENNTINVNQGNISSSEKYYATDTTANLKLRTPLKITGRYAVIIVRCEGLISFFAFEDETSSSNILKNTYTPTAKLTANGNSLMVFTALHISNNENLSAIETSNFTPQTQLNINGKKVNNLINLNNTLNFEIKNSTETISETDFSVYSIYSNQTLSFTNQTSNFCFIIQNVGSNINVQLKQIARVQEGNYVLKFSIEGFTFYKQFSVINNDVIYKINYVLQGGTNNRYNLENFTQETTSIKFYKPSFNGYNFIGWYFNENFTSPVTDLGTSTEYVEYPISEYKNLTLYAKWQLQNPTIVNEPTNINNVTYNKTYFTTSISVSHPVVKSADSFQYQWYYSENETSDYTQFSILSGQINPTLKVMNISENGYYYCLITLIIDSSLSLPTGTSSVKTSIICVNIEKGNYNLSWNYSNPFMFNNQNHTVQVSGLGNYSAGDIIANYSLTTSSKNAGTFKARVSFTNNNINYNDPVLQDLDWEIKKAPLTVTINDVLLEDANELQDFSDYSYIIDGEIYDDYQLNLNYNLVATSNPNLKLIDASFAQTDNYDVKIVTGELKIITKTLNKTIADTTITLKNENGYISDTNLTVKLIDQNELDESYIEFLNKKGYEIINTYDISIDDTTISGSNLINIHLNSDSKNYKVYQITSNGLKEIETKLDKNGLNFYSENLGQFIIVEDNSISTASLIISLIIIISLTLTCIGFIVILKLKRKFKYRYNSIDILPH